jgi:hypothetical protein
MPFSFRGDAHDSLTTDQGPSCQSPIGGCHIASILHCIHILGCYVLLFNIRTLCNTVALFSVLTA